MTDLKELNNYWNIKYPWVTINLWENQDGNKFFGIMSTADKSADLSASTIGELIGQGEAFLRSVM